MNEKNNEEFYKSICKKYVETMSKEMLFEVDNDIVHIFIEDEFIDLKEEGKINNRNYQDYLDGNFQVYKYDSYQELYNSVIKDEVIYDINDLSLFDDNGKWDFYITFEELQRMGYGDKVKYNYPLIEKYIIEDGDNFYNYFSLEQLNEFEKSLHLYYETDDMEIDKIRGLYSKSNQFFNNDIISLSEGMINYYDFVSDYKINSQTYYDLLEDKVIEYFKENEIKDLMDYGSDKDEGLVPISSLYKEILDKLGIKYDNVYTEDVSDGKYLTTITFENDSKIKIDTSAWNGINVVTENIESIYENFKKLSRNLSRNQNKNNMEYEY